MRSPKPPTLEQIAAAFPGYEVQGFLGAGGMGCVYRVRDRATGRVLALKILPRELAADPAFVERFEREARTLERLRHPSIVGIHGFGQSGGYCHLLMEHVDGANLRQALRSGRFTPAQALALIPPLCEALQFAHSQGVLHRDIKPENILLDAEGRVKIADFGIAKILGEAGTSVDEFSLTRTGARLGTPHYMAPEQVERPEDVDHRADIYSLGVVFYELLTGELPLGRFQAPSAKASLDERVDEIVLRALAKERELRQQSAGQVKAEVEGLAARGPVERGGGGGFRRRLTRRVIVGVAVATVAALVFPFLYWCSIPRWTSGPAARPASAQALVQLGLHLRGMKGAPPDGQLESKDLFGIPPELLMDPATRQPFLFVSAGRTNLEPWEILVASPPRPDGRDALLQDGSVQRFTEANFWDVMTRSRPSVLESLGRYLLGPKLEVADAETAIVQGASIAMSDTTGFHRLNVDLSGSFAQISAGHCEPAVLALHGLLRGLPWDPDREVVFNVARDSKPGADLHEKTQNRHGGLLAILAVLAARTRDGEALSWALHRGRFLWVGEAREELVLCHRRLDGESDQNWEEIRMRTEDVLRLVPGATAPMKVVRRYKAHGHAPETNRVDLAWPRLP